MRVALACPYRWEATGGVQTHVRQLSAEQRTFIAHCGDGHAPTFGGRGQSFEGPAMRGLDQYLVSVSDDRVIVNLSRLIRAEEKVPAPSQP